MRHNLRITFWTVISALLVFTCFSFVKNQVVITSEAIRPKTKPRVCIMLPTLREKRWKTDYKTFLESTHTRKDVQIVVQVSANRADLQAAQLDRLLASRCQVYVIAAHDYQDMCRQLSRYPNLKVIAYERPIPCPQVRLFIGYDAYNAGAMQAEALLKAVPRGEYLLLRGPESDLNSQLYYSGALSVLSKVIHSGSIIIRGEHTVGNWSPARAQAFVVEAWKKSNGKLAAVLSPNDALAEGVIETLKGFGGHHSVRVTGQDGEDAAKKRVEIGEQLMTIEKDVRSLVSITLDTAVTLAMGEEVNAHSILETKGIKIPAILLSPKLIASRIQENQR